MLVGMLSGREVTAKQSVSEKWWIGYRVILSAILLFLFLFLLLY